jgi:hypothetical protein
MKNVTSTAVLVLFVGWMVGCGLNNVFPPEKGSCVLSSDGGQSIPVCFDYAVAQSPLLGNSFSCGFTLFSDAGTATYSSQSCSASNRVGSCKVSEFSSSTGIADTPGIIRYYSPLTASQAMASCTSGTTAVIASGGAGVYTLVDAGSFYLTDGGTFTAN